ncbi:MAG: GGDEF domain-containing protein [Spirochaetia bacterium]
MPWNTPIASWKDGAKPVSSETFNPAQTELLLKLFNELEYSIFALCSTEFKVISANKTFFKTIHQGERLDQIDLMDYLNIDEAQKQQIRACRESYRSSLPVKPENRLFKTIFFRHGDVILFIGELQTLADMDILTSMSSLSNEAANIERQLRRKNKELESANKKIEELMRTDSLTGLYNRRYMSEFLESNMNLAKRHHLPLSLIMCDLDHFKKINDTYGHATGDTVLKGFAAIMLGSCRREDVIVRFGGEEFVLVLLNTALPQAVLVAEKIRSKVEQAPLIAGHQVSASFGVSRFEENDSQDSLIKRADDALYQSKKNGRNRTTAEASSETGR